MAWTPLNVLRWRPNEYQCGVKVYKDIKKPPSFLKYCSIVQQQFMFQGGSGTDYMGGGGINEAIKLH